MRSYGIYVSVFVLAIHLNGTCAMCDHCPKRVIRIPSPEIPTDDNETAKWVLHFASLSPSAAKEELKKRWGGLKHPANQRFAEALLTFDVDAIVKSEDCVWRLRLTRFPSQRLLENERAPIPEVLLLPSPLAINEINTRLESRGIKEVVGLSEFLSSFWGLNECDMTGVHIDESLARYPGDKPYLLRLDSEWRVSGQVYEAPDGCPLLVRRDGKAAWWVIPEGCTTEPIAFLDEVDRCANLLANYNCGITLYPPEEKNRR